MILKERMRKLWVWCCERSSSSSSSSPSSQTEAERKYEQNLRGLKKIAFVINLTIICNWFLGFCALTWASAVLLGAYIQQLSMWDYYDVSLLLFVEGLRFGLAAMVRFLGYRLWDFCRWALRSVAFFLPLGMGGFAVLSMLPPHIRHSIHLRFGGHNFRHHNINMLAIYHAFDPAPPPSDSSYKSLSPSLKIFYVLILLNAFVLLLGSSITGLMRLRYVRSSVKSLCRYHDKMMDSSTNWLHPAVDLEFAFQIQGAQYRKGKDARYVCENYADLIYYLYMHEKGVEEAEAALAREDGYVRQAAVNIMGFWAVLEKQEEVKGFKPPLCFQRGMLSKMADIAAESYGTLGIAVAQSFSLLLEQVDLELIGMVTSVRSRGTSGQDLIEILLGRTAELLYPPCPPQYNLHSILQKQSHAHVYALRQYLLRLQTVNELSNTVTRTFIEGQRAKLVKKIEDALPQLVKKIEVDFPHLVKEVKQVPADVSTSKRYNNVIIQSLDQQLLPLLQVTDHVQCLSDIKGWFRARPPPPSWRASPIKASFLLLFNVAFPLACLGVGFIMNAIL